MQCLDLLLYILVSSIWLLCVPEVPLLPLLTLHEKLVQYLINYAQNIFMTFMESGHDFQIHTQSGHWYINGINSCLKLS